MPTPKAFKLAMADNSPFRPAAAGRRARLFKPHQVHSVNHENPYEAPVSELEPCADTPPRRWGVVLLSLVAFQTLISVIYATTLVSHFRHGEISALTFLASALASVLLVAGGLMYLSKRRYAAHLFFASALFAACAYLQWHPTFLLTGLGISVCAGLVSVVVQRRLAKV